ncbi:MAG: hypothetical protein JSR66_33470 [Proteobacteria bacterium]|nr:hypothetical protein [Pseudomonadota bacterium]
MLCDDGFRNVEENGRRIGFQLRMRLANYRGYLLSQIEDIRISVDGDAIPRKDIRFAIGGKTYTLDEMEEVVDNRWELRQVATVTCLKPGGLTAGEHEVSAEEHIRASYIPMVAVARLTRTLRLA